jgi:hypothetical protein
MIDIDEALHEYAARWRDAQPPPSPGLAFEGTRRRGAPRRLVAAAVAVLVVAAVGTVLATTRGSDRSPAVNTPTTPAQSSEPAPGHAEPVAIPQIDVVPIFLWINASDIAANGDLGALVAVRLVDMTKPSIGESTALRPCAAGLLNAAMRSAPFSAFEDPGQIRGTPAVPTVAPPPAPPVVPTTCTPEIADAATRIRAITESWNWIGSMYALDKADPQITAARSVQIDCLHARGYDTITLDGVARDAISPDGYISDGWFMQHDDPDQQAQAGLDVADCIEPIAAARAEIRPAIRAEFVAAHADEVHALQAAFDDYLTAIYQPR